MESKINGGHSRLPIFKILALTIAGFIAIMTETMPAGMLQYISHSLAISQSMAGQMVSVYAVGSVVAALPLVTMTRGMNRRPLLLTAILGFMITNWATGLTSIYWLILVERFFAGMAAGLTWGLLNGYTVRLVQPSQTGKALALMGVGQPIALAIGVPAAALFGKYFHWQYMFLFIGGVSALLLIWIRALLPDFAGEHKSDRKPVTEILFTPGILVVLCIVLFWILSHNILYTYISSFLIHFRLENNLDDTLFIFGVASIIGIWLTGILVDRFLRLTTLISLGLFGFSCLFLFELHSFVVIAICVAVWGITFGGAPTLLQKSLADCAGKHIDVAQSSFVTVFNLAVSGGAIVGGGILSFLNAKYIPFASMILVILAFLVVWFAKNSAFPVIEKVSDH